MWVPCVLIIPRGFPYTLMMRIFIFLCIVFWAIPAKSGEAHREAEELRPQEPNPLATFETCKTHIESLVEKLECRVPPVAYTIGLSLDSTMEFGVQFYAARNGVSYDKLNTVISLTQTEEGKKKLAHFFTGLKCGGLPGDPLNRKNWISYLPACPEKAPSSPPWYKDNKWATGTYHPGAHVCYRLAANRPENCAPPQKTWECIGGEWFKELPKSISEILAEATPSQQCCYDSDKILIREGASAGTPDLVFKSHAVEEIVEKNLLSKRDKLKMLKMADLEKAFEDKAHSTDEKKASIDHHIMDARIITGCFFDWPGKNDIHVKTYQALGWTPYR